MTFNNPYYLKLKQTPFEAITFECPLVAIEFDADAIQSLGLIASSSDWTDLMFIIVNVMQNIHSYLKMNPSIS